MSFAITGAIIGGIGAIAAPVVAGVAGLGGAALGLAGGAASAVGSVASGVLGGAAGLAGGAASAVGGTISALTGGVAAPATGLTVAQQMAAIAEPAYYGLGVPAATGGVATGLSTIAEAIGAGAGIYGQLSQLEIAKGMTEAEKIKAKTALIEAEALKVYTAAQAAAPPKPPTPPAPPALPKEPGIMETIMALSVLAPTEEPGAPLPTLSAQPVYITPTAAPAAPNYLLYAGLAILAFLLLGKK